MRLIKRVAHKSIQGNQVLTAFLLLTAVNLKGALATQTVLNCGDNLIFADYLLSHTYKVINRIK